MFERFTPAARAVVVAAQEEARVARGRWIDSRHVLLALAKTPGVRATVLAVGGQPDELISTITQAVRNDGIDPDALAAIGVDLSEVERRADATFGPGALRSTGSRKRHLPFSKDAKKTLELGRREAIRLGERNIGDHHLMLGILRADSPGRRLLASETDLEALRNALETPDARSA